MVKLLIDLNCKESHVSIWKFIKEPNEYKIKTFGRLLIIENKCKINAWVHLGFTYHFMHILKTRFILQNYNLIKTRVLSNVP